MAEDSRVYPRAASKHVDATTVMHPVESEASEILAAKFFEDIAMTVTLDEDGFWYAESKLFDYMAYGKTREEALEHFEKGLYGTIEARVDFGLDPLLRDKGE